MGPDLLHALALSLAWVAYGALHSMLASAGAKRAVASLLPRLAPAYRLLYNAVAVLSLLPVLWLEWRHPGPWLWRWSGGWAWLADGLGLAAAVTMLVCPTGYDLAEFLGLRQLRSGRATPDDQEPFRIATLHRFVRHPWYSLVLVILWTRDMRLATLTSAVWITAYLAVGSRLEERALVERFGARYRRYQERVPGLLPRPLRVLGREEARSLAAGGDPPEARAAVGTRGGR